MSEQARISLNYNGVSFEISGSEQFVAEQIAVFKDAIIEAIEQTRSEHPLAEEEPPAAPHKETSDTPSYTKVLHIEDDKVSILKKAPGNTTSKKAIATAIIYLWAKRSIGVDSVPFNELRDQCKTQGCLDTMLHFAANMKRARQFIIIDGTKGSSVQTCKLTLPGVEEAERILSELNED